MGSWCWFVFGNKVIRSVCDIGNMCLLASHHFLKAFHYQREAIIITIMVCRFPHCFIHCCLHLFMVVSLFPTKVCDGRAFSMVCHFPPFLMVLLIKHSDGASFTTELSGDAPFLLYCTIFHTASPPIYYIVYSDIVVVHGRPVKRRRCLSIMIW